MSYDWMKIELALPDKPEVYAIAAELNLDPDAVVGKLFRVWQWFDNHTTDGNARGVTFALLDRLTFVQGFAKAMENVNWLSFENGVLTMPKFDKHTSSSAKSRANAAIRQSRFRNADSNGKVTVTALPREDIYNTNNNVSNNNKTKPKNQTKVNKDFLPNDESVKWAQKNYPQIDFKIETEKFLNYFLAKGARYSDWQLCWRNWIGRATLTPTSKQTVHDKRAQVADEMYGDLVRGMENGGSNQRGERTVQGETEVIEQSDGGGGQVVLENGDDLRKTLARPVDEHANSSGEGGVEDDDFTI